LPVLHHSDVYGPDRLYFDCFSSRTEVRRIRELLQHRRLAEALAAAEALSVRVPENRDVLYMKAVSQRHPERHSRRTWRRSSFSSGITQRSAACIRNAAIAMWP
jgi:hypothetical protein